jgi:hypothetical protein
MSTHSVGRHMQGTPLLRWRSDGPGLGQCTGSHPDSSRCRSSQHGHRATRPRRLETLHNRGPLHGGAGCAVELSVWHGAGRTFSARWRRDDGKQNDRLGRRRGARKSRTSSSENAISRPGSRKLTRRRTSLSYKSELLMAISRGRRPATGRKLSRGGPPGAFWRDGRPAPPWPGRLRSGSRPGLACSSGSPPPGRLAA